MTKFAQFIHRRIQRNIFLSKFLHINNNNKMMTQKSRKFNVELFLFIHSIVYSISVHSICFPPSRQPSNTCNTRARKIRKFRKKQRRSLKMSRAKHFFFDYDCEFCLMVLVNTKFIKFIATFFWSYFLVINKTSNNIFKF